jgi:hypothetical protein
MLAMCVECGQGVELLLPIDQRSLSAMLAQVGWFISVLSPPGQRPDASTVIGPLCAACAQQVYPPEIYKAAEQRRQQLLQVLQQQPAPQGTPPQGTPPQGTPPQGTSR